MKLYNLGVEATLDIIGGKWKVLILCLLIDGKKRTAELQRSIPSISQKVLVQQLRQLEADGVVHRIVYDQLPPKVEYHMTDYGNTLIEIIDLMCSWGRQNIEKRVQHGEEIVLKANDSKDIDFSL